MPQRYIHYLGNEAGETLLEAYGIIPKDKKNPNTLKPKECPNCDEPNKPDARFCAKCKFILSYDGYTQSLKEQQQKDEELQKVKERMSRLENILVSIQPLLQHIRPENLSKLEIFPIQKKLSEC